MRKITGVKAEVIFKNDDGMYLTSVDDATLVLQKTWYGEDADGNRGVLQYCIKNIEIDPQDVRIFYIGDTGDCNNEVEDPDEDLMAESIYELEQELYFESYERLL